jgi:large subunit ribosomal protein L18
MMFSNKNIYVQFIDDEKGVTLASVSSSLIDGGKNMDMAGKLGKKAAEAARSKGITNVLVDRGGFKFHGRLKAVVDNAVSEGLIITTEPKVRDAKEG